MTSPRISCLGVRHGPAVRAGAPAGRPRAVRARWCRCPRTQASTLSWRAWLGRRP